MRSIYELTDEGYPQMFYSYMDEPEKVYNFLFSCTLFTTLDGEVYVNSIYDNANFLNDVNGTNIAGTYIMAYSVDEYEYERLRADEEAYYDYQESLTGKYSDYTIYSTAKNDFKSGWLDKMYSLSEQLYMTVDYQGLEDATYYYDPNMKTYNIRFEVVVGESFGFFKTTYVVQAVYYESNGGLKASMFNVY